MNSSIAVAGTLGLIVVGVSIAALLPKMSNSDSNGQNDASIISEATSGLLTAPTGTVFEASCDASLDYDAQAIDLNMDGQPEVFTQIYGTCIGGGTGALVDLYIKDKSSRWNSQFGFPGVYSVLDTKNLGYPDIQIGGPGNCFPVWRWDGELYELYESCPP